LTGIIILLSIIQILLLVNSNIDIIELIKKGINYILLIIK